MTRVYGCSKIIREEIRMAMIEKYEDILKKYDYMEEARDVELLLDVKRKLLTNSIDRVDLLCLTDLGFKIKYENK